MLRFVDRHGRREFLRVGGLTLGGLTLSHLLQVKAQAASSSFLRDKSVVFLFQHGGPSQFETFDPKMTAPAGVRCVNGAISTSTPGVEFGSTMSRLSRLSHLFTVVRSYRSGSSAHLIQPIVSKSSLDANIGSLFARAAGTNDPVSGMPRNVAVFPNSVDPESLGPVTQFGNFLSPGALGAAYAPFQPGADGPAQQDMRLSIERTRLDDRRRLMRELARVRRRQEGLSEDAALGRVQQQAFDVILGGVADAFDLAQEAPETIARYDTSPLFNEPASWKHKNNRDRYTANAHTLGKLMLLARRLCEFGCGFVTVTSDFVWDMHADVNNLGVDPGMKVVGRPFDHAVAAFIEDVEQRGLRDKILLVATGEMGRTPKINNNGGRDHWGNLTPLLLYGAGVEGGRVIGQSTRDGGSPATDPVTSENLIGTIMHTLFDVGQLRLARDLPTDVARLITGYPPIQA